MSRTSWLQGWLRPVPLTKVLLLGKSDVFPVASCTKVHLETRAQSGLPPGPPCCLLLEGKDTLLLGSSSLPRYVLLTGLLPPGEECLLVPIGFLSSFFFGATHQHWESPPFFCCFLYKFPGAVVTKSCRLGG